MVHLFFRRIAETIGRQLKVPVKSVTGDEVQEYFGSSAMFAGLGAGGARVDRGSRGGALLREEVRRGEMKGY